MCLVTWPWFGSEAGGELVLIQTRSLFFRCKCKLVSIFKEQHDLHMKSNEVCIKTRSPPASLPMQGQVTKHRTVKWPILIGCEIVVLL